ncbi:MULTISPECIES: RICIN domain-containing protein [Microbacterium]|uniref:RICIN domain-containing protein n=1 Tax=Microbacterium TaxID=33882 RepID=UPI002784F7C4|nr:MULTISPECIES: RICIN domain-containing protein [Microbacterium]MDQ1082419.1 hypothetical protein [Microbacterium sp. SORGH_AS_0344]MDQ1168810.1 hypothetical protein [Microbacterium proteolyticum]
MSRTTTSPTGLRSLTSAATAKALGAALLAVVIALATFGTAAPAAASDTGPAVSAVASARCAAGKVLLVTRATNDSDAPATITITSAWASKTHTAVAAGATVSTSTTVRAAAVEAGTVQVTSTAASGSRTVSAPFAATRCLGTPVAPVGTGPNQEIRNQQNTLCLDDYNYDTTPGAEVRQWTCMEGQNQLWGIADRGNGYAEIKNTYSGLCLDTRNSGPGVHQWTCGTGTGQQWQLTDVGGGWTEIRNRSNGLCLESTASPIDGGVLAQVACNGTGVQRWRLTDPNVSKITYTLAQSSNPSADEIDAYARITDAMDRAVARFNRFNNTQLHLRVSYAPGVATADATINGDVRFGADRSYMVEGTALHEMSHTVGVGTAWNFQAKCDAQDWPAALPLLRSWDGDDARINCGGSHMWPYGLNYSSEFSETAFDRNVRLVQAMKHDGL